MRDARLMSGRLGPRAAFPALTAAAYARDVGVRACWYSIGVVVVKGVDPTQHPPAGNSNSGPGRWTGGGGCTRSLLERTVGYVLESEYTVPYQ